MSSAIDVNSLTSVLLIQTLAQSGLLSSAAGAATPANSSVQSSTHPPPVSGPQTPTRQKTRDPSPVLVPSLPHLTRYLEYAEVQLAVRHGLAYKGSLQLNGIDPDILADVEDKFLTELGVSAGDPIHLKKGSTAWWNGPDAKRKRSDTVSSDADFRAEVQAVKKAAYEKWYHDGGGSQFTGPPMQAGDSPLNLDYDLYFSDGQNQWLPVLHGFTIDEDVELDQLGNFF